MKKKRVFQAYTIIWIFSIIFLCALVFQTAGDARVVNYSGIVRGATQKLVKEELNGQQDDELILYLDDIIYDLQTGKGKYNLVKSYDKKYQSQLTELKVVWVDMKEEITIVRSSERAQSHLYDLSQTHFTMANQMVHYAERYSNQKLISFIIFYFACLILSISAIIFMSKRAQKAIRSSIYQDNLTNLLSRTGFEDCATSWLHKHPKSNCVIVEFDIDNFKIINDVCGFQAGDKLLMEIAKVLTNMSDDIVVSSRIDADDFIILMEEEHANVPEIEVSMKKASAKMPYFAPFGGISFTFGAYRINDNNELIKTIMDKANTAHKTSKKDDRRTLVWYDEQLMKILKQENRYKERMHQALNDNEFKLYLQPKIDLQTMKVMGAEALVRWITNEGEVIYPDSYIELFEKNGYIADLDFYMLEKTCAFLKEYLDNGGHDFVISVNFSRLTLYLPDFYNRFLDIVHRFALPHNCLEIEVTESAFNQIADPILQMLGQLHDDGFTVSMDDFGAGYSNLNHLSRLPIQVIKLDRDFLIEMEHNANIREIISSVIKLSHAMNINVICEGVELLTHVEFLQSVGCEYAQGYYFSKPIPNEQFAEQYLNIVIS